VVIINILNIIDNVYEKVEVFDDVLKLITKTNNMLIAMYDIPTANLNKSITFFGTGFTDACISDLEYTIK